MRTLSLCCCASISPRRTGMMWQNGSPFSNRTADPGRVNFQFMVKLYGDQSVSITPVNGAMASFGLLIGPEPSGRSRSRCETGTAHER